MPSALVPVVRGATRLAKYGYKVSPYSKYVRAAGMVYRNRRGIKRGARVIGRAVNRYRSKKRRTATFKPNPSVRISSKSNAIFSTGTVGYRELTCQMVNFKRSGIGIGERVKTTPYCQGIKLNELFSYNGNDNNRGKDVIIHYMFCQMKNEKASGGGYTNSEIADDLNNEFFRDASSNTSKDSNFVDFTGTEGWDFKYNVNSVNPSQIRILYSKKMVMSALSLDQIAGTRRHIMRINKWIPIKRRIEFTGPSSTIPERPFFSMVWLQSVESRHHPVTAEPNFLNREVRNVTYIKDY